MNVKKDKNDLIERYIYDITRRLPEDERSEVRREFEANIADMLQGDSGDSDASYTEDDIKEVLTTLGPPRKIAEQYRQKPRYLISPAMYELYISVLKLVVLIVGVVCLCVGILMAVFSPSSIGESIGNAIGMGFEGAVQAALWVTLGFVIADRAGVKEKAWTVDDLPCVPEQEAVTIPRSESIVEMILSVFFPVFVILMITRGEWFFVLVQDAQIIIPFSEAALFRAIPYLIIFGIIGLVMGILKLIFARWNFRLCLANIIQNVAWLCVSLYIIRWPDLISEEMLSFTYTTFADEPGMLGFIQSGGLIIFFSVIFVVAILIDIITSIRKTYKGRRELEN